MVIPWGDSKNVVDSGSMSSLSSCRDGFPQFLVFILEEGFEIFHILLAMVFLRQSQIPALKIAVF